MGPSLFQVPRQEFDSEKSKVINDIFNKSQLADVTLLNGRDEFSAHKLILASVSPVLRSVFERSSQNPILFLRGTESRHIKSMLSFIYTGEASVEVRDIDEFIKLGSDLEIKGLDTTEEEKKQEIRKIDFVKQIQQKFNEEEEKRIKKQRELSCDRPSNVSQEELQKLKNDPYIKSYQDSVAQMFEMINEMKYKCLSCGLEQSRKKIKKHVESHLEGAFEHKCNNCGKTFDRLYKLLFPFYHPCHKNLSIVENDDQGSHPKKFDSIVNNFSLTLKDPIAEQSSEESMNIETNIDTQSDSFGVDGLNKEVKVEPTIKSIPFKSQKTIETKNYEKDIRRRTFATEYFQEYDRKLTDTFIRVSKDAYQCKVCSKVAAHTAHIKDHCETHLNGQFHYVCKCGESFNRMSYVRRHLPCAAAIEDDRERIQRQIDLSLTTTEDRPVTVPVGEYEVMIDNYLGKNPEAPFNWLCTGPSCEFNQSLARHREEALRHIEETHLPHVSFTCDAAACGAQFERYSLYKKHAKTCDI